MKKNVAFTLISFAVLKREECLSVQLPFELPVQFLLDIEANLLVRNLNELEFELPRIKMKQPIVEMNEHKYANCKVHSIMLNSS